MKLSLSILIELLLGVASLAAQASAPTVAAPEPLVAVFATGAMVRSEGVFSTDLIQGIPALPRVRVAPAPQVGAWSQLSRTSVVEALRIAGVDLSLVRWTGPESARISRAMRELGEAEVRDQITQELQRRFARNGGEIEVRLSRPWRSVSIPDESLDIRLLDLPTAGLQSLISLKVEGLVATHPGPSLVRSAGGCCCPPPWATPGRGRDRARASGRFGLSGNSQGIAQSGSGLRIGRGLGSGSGLFRSNPPPQDRGLPGPSGRCPDPGGHTRNHHQGRSPRGRISRAEHSGA